MKSKIVWTVAAVILAGIVVSTVKWYYHGLLAGKEQAAPCRSMEEARQRGTLVREVSIVPASIEWQGSEIHFGQAWIEEATERKHYMVWFPRYERVGWTYLCFRLERGEGVFSPLDSGRQPFFVLDEEGTSVRMSFGTDGLLFWNKVDAESLPELMSLVSSWSDRLQKNITIR